MLAVVDELKACDADGFRALKNASIGPLAVPLISDILVFAGEVDCTLERSLFVIDVGNDMAHQPEFLFDIQIIVRRKTSISSCG